MKIFGRAGWSGIESSRVSRWLGSTGGGCSVFDREYEDHPQRALYAVLDSPPLGTERTGCVPRFEPCVCQPGRGARGHMRRKLSEADPEKLASDLQRLSGEKLNQHFKIIYGGIRIVR